MCLSGKRESVSKSRKFGKEEARLEVGILWRQAALDSGSVYDVLPFLQNHSQKKHTFMFQYSFTLAHSVRE